MSDKPGKIEHFEKQFGIIAIEKGFITADNLIEALKIQVEEELKYKKHRLIGEILMENNHITANQIQETLNSIFVR
jgi:tRNA U34 5-methylaminomethyl-2-thiouridine-forming methyltransferase MnmC